MRNAFTVKNNKTEEHRPTEKKQNKKTERKEYNEIRKSVYEMRFD